MASGKPLTDDDRGPWLALVRRRAEEIVKAQEGDEEFAGRRGLVVACSALKRKYRDVLRGVGHPDESTASNGLPTYVVFIKGDRETIWERMSRRQGHFMKAEMLDSQLATLESPEGEEGVVVVRLEDETQEQARKARDGLNELVRPL